MPNIISAQTAAKLIPKSLKDGTLIKTLKVGSAKTSFFQRFVYEGADYSLPLIPLSSLGSKILAIGFDPKNVVTLLFCIDPKQLTSTFDAEPLPELPPAKVNSSFKAIIKVLRTARWLDAKSGEFSDHDVPTVYTHDPDCFVTAYSYGANKPIEKMGSILIPYYKMCNENYHISREESPLTDSYYDKLKKIMEENNIAPKLLKKVGAPIPVDRAKVQLPHVMGSLVKVKTTDELLKWGKKSKITEVETEPKIDGTSTQLIYVKGVLKHAYSRGETDKGVTIGLDITRHVMEIPDVPKKLKKPVSIDVRGELFMLPKDFVPFKRSEKNPKGFRNPRNAVAGQWFRLQPNKAVLNKVRLLTYHIFDSTLTKTQQFKLLESLGLPVVKHELVTLNPAGVKKIHNKLLAYKKSEQIIPLLLGLTRLIIPVWTLHVLK
jgi:hypothetical protein